MGSARKKILCVIDNLGSGGAQRQLVLIGVGLKKRGYDVDFFTYYPDSYFSSMLEANDIKIIFAPKKSRFSPLPILALRRCLAERGVDILISFLDTPNVYAELACIGKDVSLVVSERSSYVKEHIALTRMLMSNLHRLADVVVANSNTHASWLKINFPYLSKKVTSIINGVNTELFAPAETLDCECNEPGRSRRTALIGIGRISSEKNILPVISALSRLRGRDMDVTVDWVGRVGDESYFLQCEQLIEDKSLLGFWNWLGEREDIPTLLPVYDALIISSTREGFPNVVCEALACGVPVLASSISDIPYLIGGNERGFLFDPLDSDEIENTMAGFHEMNSDDRIKIGQSAREFAKTMLSLDTLIDNYEKLICSMGI